VTDNTDLARRLIGVLGSVTGTPALEYERQPEPMPGGFRPSVAGIRTGLRQTARDRDRGSGTCALNLASADPC